MPGRLRNGLWPPARGRAGRSCAGAALAVMLAAGACAPAHVPHVHDPSPWPEEDLATRERAAPIAVRPPPGRRQLTVERAALHAALDRGPGAFLRGLELRPHLRDDRFAGWELVQLVPAEARAGDIDLRPGDVVGAINGRLLARPEDLATLWAELRSASTIVVEMHRGGQRFELRFEIIDAANAPSP